MNAELPPFKNGEDNSKSEATLDCDITPLSWVDSIMTVSGVYLTQSHESAVVRLVQHRIRFRWRPESDSGAGLDSRGVSRSEISAQWS